MDKNAQAEETPPLLGSPYILHGPNEPIKFGEEPLCLTTDKERMEGVGSACILFRPRPRLRIVGSFPTMVPEHRDGENRCLNLPNRGLEVPGFVRALHRTADAQGVRSALEWTVSPGRLEVSGNDDTPVERVLFHLVNFLDFQSTRKSVETTRTTEGDTEIVTDHLIFNLMLEWSDYVVHVRSLTSTSETVKALRDEGGFGVTHLGVITQKNGIFMSVSDVKKLIEGLTFFFSFSRGAWSPPILPIGYDVNGVPVWELWDSPRGEPYLHNLSWLDNGYGEHLESLFPGFMKLWTNPAWHDAMKETIYWYLNSNYSSRGIDAGIILTQTAIECLCFAHSVQNNKLLSKAGFRGLKAPDLFRLLFGSLDVPQEIPPTLPEIMKLAGEFNWVDAPQALVEMRNKLVHPAIDKRGKFDAATFEAWNLGLWYVEMVVLRLCGYVGQYSNRLKVKKELFEVEKVPWAP